MDTAATNTLIDVGTRKTLEAVRDGDRAYSVYFIGSGAGAGLQALLWAVCGCSRFLSGAEFPYAQDATDRVLGFSPGKYATESTAVDMAITAFLKAVPLTRHASPVGVGLAASVASNELHRGDHRVHVAVMTDDGCRLTSAVLVKGAGDEARARDGRVADMLALHALFQAIGAQTGLGDSDAINVFDSGHDVTRMGEPADELALERLLANPLILPDCRRRPVSVLDPLRTMIHACTANPPHAGHVQGALAALDSHHGHTAVTTRLIHSLTLDPPNKPRVSVPEALRRARLFGRMERDMLVSAGDPLYVHKAERFPGSPLVLGADAAMKILDPRWGVNSREALATFKRLGTKLYVVGRQVEANGKTEFVTLEHTWLRSLIPDEFLFLFMHVPGRWDVSSTALRAETA